MSVRTVGCVCLIAFSLHAQEFRATISGRVIDSSQSAVPRATVTATNTETNVASKTETADTGDYSLPFLNPGNYKIYVTQTGFKTFERTGIALRVSDRVTVDIQLEIGTLAETVTVTAAPPLVDTSSASLGEVVSGRAVVDMPLNGRNPFTLVGLVPGAMPTGRGNFNFFERTSNAGTSSYNISISGGPQLGNELLLDGVSMIGGNNAVLYSPSVDATQEFKVQTNSFDAELGRFAGGVINATTKSGTNEVHGTLFEFHRNSALNARDYFAASKPQFQYNQFGGSVGAPVYIPKLYNGKDKTFFFFNYEGSREGVPRSFVTTVPTELERAGNFSQTRTRVAGVATPVLIYDPATTTQAGSAYTRAPFPGNAIPSARFDAVARNMIPYYELPNTAGDAVTNANNFRLAYKDPVLDNGFIARVDQRIGERNQLFVRTSWRHFRVRRQGEFQNVVTDDGEDRTSPGISVDDTMTLNPTTVLTLRAGVSRMVTNQAAARLGIDPASLGFPASLTPQLAVVGMPGFAVPGYQTLGSKTLQSISTETQYNLRATVMKQLGRQSVRFGGESRMIRSNSLNPGNAGSYTFSTVFTRGPNPQVANAAAGNGLASFLLGAGASGNTAINANPAMQSPYYGFYIQDDIRLTSRLNINLGFRYEWEGLETERYNNLNREFFNEVSSPIEAQAIAAYAANPLPELPASAFKVRGGIGFAGVDQARGSANRDLNNFAPRVGIVYQVAPKTVLRAGYGTFYGPTTAQSETRQGFSASTPWVPTANGGLTIQDPLSNPFPTGLIAPTGSSLGLMTNVGQALSFVNTDRKNSLLHQYQLSIQRQLDSWTIIEAAYSGSIGRNLGVADPIDAIPLEAQIAARNTFLQTGRNVLNDSFPNPFRGLITTGTLNTATVTRGQLLRPYPHYTSVAELDSMLGRSRYDSFQLKVSRRFANGMSLLGSYTLAKLFRQQRFLNDVDQRPVKELADYDVPQRLVISGIYELPFGRSRRFFSGAKGVAGKLIEGWQINGVYTAQGGVPVIVSAGESLGRSAKLAEDQQSLSRWFDTSAFRQLQTLEFVSTSTLPDVRTQGRNQFDLSLFKDTWIGEKLRAQLRMEAFNAFNRTEFGGPGGAFGGTAFGVVSSQINFARQIQLALKLIW